MDRIEVYTFEDGDGNEFGTFTTRDLTEAKLYAFDHQLRVIARIFEYVDSEEVVDYTGSEPDPDDDGDEEDEGPDEPGEEDLVTTDGPGV